VSLLHAKAKQQRAIVVLKKVNFLAASGKRQAASGKRQAASGKRQDNFC
jgi:hypothetical protein